MTRYNIHAAGVPDKTTLSQIKQILRESPCPHESLKAGVPNYAGMQDQEIYLDALGTPGRVAIEVH